MRITVRPDSAVGGHSTRIPVRPLLVLQARLVRRTLARSAWSALGSLLFVASLVPFLLVTVLMAIMVAEEYPDRALHLWTLQGAVVVAVFTLGLLFIPGSGAVLSLDRLSAYPVTPRSLRRVVICLVMMQAPQWAAGAFLLATTIGIGLGSSVAAHPAVLLVVLPLSVILSVALVVVTNMTVQAYAASQTVSRADKERRMMALTIGVSVVVVLIYGIAYYGSSLSSRSGLHLLEQLGAVAQWTPFGAPFAMAVTAAQGQWGRAAVHAGIAVLTVVVLDRLWQRWVRQALLSPPSAVSGVTVQSRGLLLPRMPQTVQGALVSQAMRYWVRDSQYKGALTSPIVVVIIMLIVAQGEAKAVLPLLFATRSLSSILANDWGCIGPANWMLLSSPTPSRKILQGRWAAAAALLLLVGVLTAVFIAVVILDDPQYVLPLVMGSVGDSLSVLAVFGILSLLNPHPTAQAGTNPLKDRSNSSGRALVTSLAVTVGSWLPMLPGWAFGFWAVTTWGSSALVWGALAVLINGVLVAWGCYHWGARLLDRRYPEIFAAVRSHV